MNLLKAAKQKEKGSLIKLKDYFDAYDFHFAKYKHNAITLLEIGVYKGGSLWMWKKYFPLASICGIDRDASCKKWEGNGISIYIGSQEDRVFLNSVASNYKNGFDIIVDDGGHKMFQQQISFTTLFPFLNDGGVYVIEDTHTSYWPKWGGGLNKENTTIEYLKLLVDKTNSLSLQDKRAQTSGISFDYFDKNISSIHFHNSMCFIYKNKNKSMELVEI